MASNPWDVYPLDEESTKKAVEEKLEEVELYRRVGTIRREAKMTASYELREGSSGGMVSKTTENIAVFNVDRDAYLEKWDGLLKRAFKTLKKKQRDIIERSYMDFDKPSELEIATELGMGTTAYARHKSAALINLATTLGLEVMMIPCPKCQQFISEKENGFHDDGSCIYCCVGDEDMEPGA
ncbi:MAG: ArpU family phage packaging/lysis transcriptional regulator [Aerococcus urinaeequi]